jgi:hypothetical protein
VVIDLDLPGHLPTPSQPWHRRRLTRPVTATIAASASRPLARPPHPNRRSPYGTCHCPDTATMYVTADRLYLAEHDGTRLSAYQLPDGRPLWTRTQPAARPTGRRRTCGRVDGLDVRTGHTAWSYRIAQSQIQVEAGDLAVLITQDGAAQARSLTDGALRATATLPVRGSGPPRVRAVGGFVVIEQKGRQTSLTRQPYDHCRPATRTHPSPTAHRGCALLGDTQLGVVGPRTGKPRWTSHRWAAATGGPAAGVPWAWPRIPIADAPTILISSDSGEQVADMAGWDRLGEHRHRLWVTAATIRGRLLATIDPDGPTILAVLPTRRTGASSPRRQWSVPPAPAASASGHYPTRGKST